MKLPFYKYEGTGNDFVILDNRDGKFPSKDQAFIAGLCDRHFGIGADGVILIEEHNQYAFEMVYFNADGNIGSFCGNGSRCVVHLARSMGLCTDEVAFYAYDGEHFAFVTGENKINVKLLVIDKVSPFENDFIVETGSPHYVRFVEDAAALDAYQLGKEIRNSEPFIKEGINVNFAEIQDDGSIKMRTYERGVENETLACGTGTVAVAMAAQAHDSSFQEKDKITIHALGGTLEVRLQRDGVWLEGPVSNVFKGFIDVDKFMS